VLRLWRRFFGTAQLAEQQQLFDVRNERRYRTNIRAALSLGNALTLSRLDQAALESSATYQRCAELVSLLSPLDLEGARYARLGGHHDGGYVMVDNFDSTTIDAAYGFGIGRNTSWDTAVAARGIDVFMFDHTLPVLPDCGPRCHPRAYGVTGRRTGERLRTLADLVAETGHSQSHKLLMKLDVEGCEWDVLSAAPSRLLEQFSQVVVEYHQLTWATTRTDRFEEFVSVLKKVNETHQCVHVHGNVARLPMWVGPLVLPDILEVTYVRKDDWRGRFSPCTRQFPTDLDEPCEEGWPDIQLGSFRPPGRPGAPTTL